LDPASVNIVTVLTNGIRLHIIAMKPDAPDEIDQLEYIVYMSR
jgi:hypothetical protein